jgi:hypothetical protein
MTNMAKHHQRKHVRVIESSSPPPSYERWCRAVAAAAAALLAADAEAEAEEESRKRAVEKREAMPLLPLRRPGRPPLLLLVVVPKAEERGSPAAVVGAGDGVGGGGGVLSCPCRSRKHCPRRRQARMACPLPTAMGAGLPVVCLCGVTILRDEATHKGVDNQE